MVNGISSKETININSSLTNVSDLVEVTGVVKWFDLSKGYGFFVPDNGSKDVLLHVTCLRRDGYQSILAGTRIVALVYKRERGYQAFKILSADRSNVIKPSSLSKVDSTFLNIVPKSEIERVTVKWFDRVRGFGFLTRSEHNEDIFIHMEVLRQFGLTWIYPKQTVLVRFGHTKKGLIAVEIHPDTENLIQRSH
ncbi:Cold shock protein CspB [Liberibacter crescens BT-1]|uniref:Cold shock protein CspB n=1 Tax=Liberibacter crescens (strain BT-1) TaxID=1215343 RepID=L0EUB2_LIBCB|nr:cold shock protein [Liberibacter crescens]AGA64440.1 Cold shock protein CspB [Liberibacter crescens BT-1]AMC12619.1 cold-shock protein [Liberibacter crescens]